MQAIELYRSIKVYPTFEKCERSTALDVDAPIMEDDDGRICFTSTEEKKRWMRLIRARDYRRQQKG